MAKKGMKSKKAKDMSPTEVQSTSDKAKVEVQDPEALMKSLIARGKKKGFLTYEEINTFDNIILTFENEGSAGDGAVAHRDDPLGRRHLFVERDEDRRHLFRDSPGDDHQIGLPGRRTEHLGAEAGDVKAGHGGGHHFDGAARQPEGHRPEGVGPRQV